MEEARLGFAESGGGGGPAYHVTLFTSITLYKLCSTGQRILRLQIIISSKRYGLNSLIVYLAGAIKRTICVLRAYKP